MSKNIIVCSDGTGNTTIKGRGTNVFKLFEAVDLNGHRTDPRLMPQVAIYDDGVGTESFKPLKILGGATGFGLARNVRQLYTSIVRIYDPGDRIFLFGFSRGAFTVRTLSGLIAKCGILDFDKLKTAGALAGTVSKAYRTYRRSYRTVPGRALHFVLKSIGLRDPDDRAMEKFRETNSLHQEVPIAFLGVWDTVDAVGTPFRISDVINTLIHRFKFPDHELIKNVRHACHALSLDDARESFHPLLWKEDTRIEQVWFAGVHSNVGGGYPKQGMSLVTLDWMMQKAEESGLRILPDDRKTCREHGSVDDKLYDSRAGLGVFYRWLPRDMAAICKDAGVEPVVHVSVMERIAHGTDDYAPGNLARNAKVVITPTGDDAQDAHSKARALAVQAVLQSAHQTGSSLLSRVGGTILIGRISYWLYVLSCVAVLVAASILENGGSLLNPWTALKGAAELLYAAATGNYGALAPVALRLLEDSLLVAALAAGFALAALLALFTDHRMSAVFSKSWHLARRRLRLALRDAGRGGDGLGRAAGA